ncbi:hypothetical protein C4565_01815 [Candidatus Parcubacteria bacterium]|jgi:hypothetical protein|nr:MAG: hypothetical protein C4565_01815 [Candidatus Parcubacteria bacterium]
MEDLFVFFVILIIYFAIGLLISECWYRKKILHMIRNGDILTVNQMEKRLLKMWFLWPFFFPYHYFKLK